MENTKSTLFKIESVHKNKMESKVLEDVYQCSSPKIDYKEEKHWELLPKETNPKSSRVSATHQMWKDIQSWTNKWRHHLCKGIFTCDTAHTDQHTQFASLY